MNPDFPDEDWEEFGLTDEFEEDWDEFDEQDEAQLTLASGRRQREELRLDVDGLYPQMTASGLITHNMSSAIHWIARLRRIGRSRGVTHRWLGNIWYKEGSRRAFPYTHVLIRAVGTPHHHQRKVTVTFSGGGGTRRTRTYHYKSQYFHPVNFEYDREQGIPAITRIDTHAHPNRPAGLPREQLSIKTVYRRAGFDVTMSSPGSVPSGIAGPNTTWSNAEMHDAMQTYWSRFAGRAQWAMWVFFARQHDMGSRLGGIMFDSIGPNHRQGTAMFDESFIANAPGGDPDPAAWVDRMKFWTACHEMGHAFNLAHSWQKALGTPWISLSNEPEARSFMNYPYFVTGGEKEFFSNFEFRFSPSELLFMRHAPARFVQMGNADWFDHHGFEEAEVLPDSAFTLEIRVHRKSVEFEFMEPVVAELKLKNVSGEPQIVDENVLSSLENITLIIKKDGGSARQYFPYARYCEKARKRVLQPNDALYASVNLSAGLNGWDLAEPGYYTLQTALQLEAEDIVSLPFRLRVAPPRSYDEEYLSQDFFDDSVGRIMYFDGSQFFQRGNDTLNEVIAKLGKKRVALHARLALGIAAGRKYKTLDLGSGPSNMQSAHAVGGKIKESKANVKDSRDTIEEVLKVTPQDAAESLGHINFRYYGDKFSGWLKEQGDAKAANNIAQNIRKILKGRGVPDHIFDQSS